jgi:hypothetical protein
MSNLRDRIGFEVGKGNLKARFFPQEVAAFIRRNGNTLAGKKTNPKHITSYLNNHSVGPGDRVGFAVQRSQNALFVKHRDGGPFSVIERDRLRREVVSGKAELTEIPAMSPNKPRKSVKQDDKYAIALKFVEYLRGKPYRALTTHRNQLQWGSGPYTGWQSRLDQYQWKRKKWGDTKRQVDRFVRRLKTLHDHQHTAAPLRLEKLAGKIYNGIKKWGNEAGAELDGKQVYARLHEVWNHKIRKVDSTLTKMYAFAMPNEFVIYDSRVAAAILSIAEDIYRVKQRKSGSFDSVERFQRHYPNLGLYKETRGGTRPRGYRSSKWPKAYKNVNAQLDANDLCSRIVRVLNSANEGKTKSWELRDVEAVLFMEGY